MRVKLERETKGCWRTGVLNIPCLILLCPWLSSAGWLAIRETERKRASGKGNEDTLLQSLQNSWLSVKFTAHTHRHTRI